MLVQSLPQEPFDGIYDLVLTDSSSQHGLGRTTDQRKCAGEMETDERHLVGDSGIIKAFGRSQSDGTHLHLLRPQDPGDSGILQYLDATPSKARNRTTRETRSGQNPQGPVIETG